MNYVIDRISEGIAVCEREDGSFVKMDAKNLPSNAVEGDLLTEQNGILTVDKQGSEMRRKAAQSALDKLCDE